MLRWIGSAALLAFAALPVSAVTIALTTELDDGVPGSFGSVEVIESGGALELTVTLTGALGASADLHELYFNLPSAFTGVAITADDAPTTPYALASPATVGGGAGSSFDYSVSFGNGAGPRGNGVLTSARFTLSADQPLSVAAILGETSSTSQDIAMNFAVHVQGTALTSATSETVGGLVPEPGTLALLGVGLGGIGLWRRTCAARAGPPA